MTQGKHTPGPWCRNIKPASKYTTVWAGRNTHVAYVAPQGLSEEEIEGNINLIVSAPTTLKALESLIDNLSPEAWESLPECVQSEVMAAYVAARAS